MKSAAPAVTDAIRPPSTVTRTFPTQPEGKSARFAKIIACSIMSRHIIYSHIQADSAT